jgi:hypothetical protein
MEPKVKKPDNRRRKKLIRLDLQLKIVFIMLFVTSIVLLINFQLTLVGILGLDSQFGNNAQSKVVLDSIRQMMLLRFLISAGLAVPLAASVGILYSFKFCGPIYRFKKYFTDLVNGRWDQRCSLRKDDDLKDVCASINCGIDVFRGHIRSSHGLLQEVGRYLESTRAKSDSPERSAELKELLANIAGEAVFYEKKFGEEEEPAPESDLAPPADSSTESPAEESREEEAEGESPGEERGEKKKLEPQS